MTVGAACLFGLSIVARAETADKKLRVNEYRLNANIKKDAEADPSKGVFSNITNGQKVLELATSDKKGEVFSVNSADLRQSQGVAVEKLDDAGVV